MCNHKPRCPSGTALSGIHARITAFHPEQGWYRLCNGVLLFDDGGALLVDRRVISPQAALADRRCLAG
jgi:Family of unknown function (DUF5999)